MKNNFKFKVWDKQKHVFIPDDVYAIFNENIFGAFGMMIKDWEDYREGKFFYDNAQEIIYSTGLHDCNGREIWEGDILDFDEREWGGKFKPEVIWMENIIGDWDYCGSEGDVSECRTVIGNIYENPELLNQTT